MTVGHDFLSPDAAVAEGSSNEKLIALMAEQSNYLSEIFLNLRKLNADVLCSTVVKGTSQFTNAITDLNSHEVTFEIGGKPVSIYKLLAFSSYTSGDAALPITMSILSLANAKDGWLVPTATAWNPIYLPISVRSLWVRIPTLAASNNCIVNGPADSTYGGLFLYGFTIPDYDRIRGASRG